VDHDVDVEIGMETADVHFEMKGMESLNRNFCPDAKYLKVGACLPCRCARASVPPPAATNARPAVNGKHAPVTNVNLSPCLQYRRLLVDWMCEVGDELHLFTSTMHVAVMYLDRMLQLEPVPKGRLQLIAIGCMLVASKSTLPIERVWTMLVADPLLSQPNTRRRRKGSRLWTT
jgi:hypothetical protein